MIRYFFLKTKIETSIAAAETGKTADKLIARGYLECDRAYYVTWWQLRDRARKAVLAQEDADAFRRLTYDQRVRLGV